MSLHFGDSEPGDGAGGAAEQAASPQPALDAAAEPGTVAGAYRLVDVLGRGSASSLHRARPCTPAHAERDYAVRIIELGEGRQAGRREHLGLVVEQAETMLALEHPNLVRIHALGARDDGLFVVMEYVHGVSLRMLQGRFADESVPVPVPVVLYIVGQILAGLCALHDLRDEQGNLWPGAHRAVHSGSVLLGFAGDVKLGDPDLAVAAHLTAPVAASTAAQRGAATVEASPSDDVRALGLILHGLVGASPADEASGFRAPVSLRDDVVAALREQHGDEGPAVLQDVLAGVLASGRRRRLSSPQAMLAALSPLLPPVRGMDLAVGELTRRLCLDAFKEDMRVGGGLPVGSDPGIVALCSDDEALQESLADLLLDRGYWVELHDDTSTLQDSTRYRMPPAVALVDLASEAFAPGRFVEQMDVAGNPVQVIAISKDGLTVASVQRAHELGAIDLLATPLSLDRTLLAVDLAARGESQWRNRQATRTLPWVGVPKVLVVTEDEALVRRLVRPLIEWGFAVEVANGRETALQTLGSASFESVVIDGRAGQAATDELIGQLRSLPGVGIVPVLSLASRDAMSGPGLSKRVMVRQASDAPVVLATAVRALCATAHVGRSHTRYDAALTVELLHEGNVLHAQTVNVSRRGLALRCAHELHSGDTVGVTLHLPESTEPIRAHGIVIVPRPSTGSRVDVKLGVQLHAFDGKGEARWVELVTRLHHGQELP